MVHDDQQPESAAAAPEPPPGISFFANPAGWVRENRAKAEILGIGIVSIALIFCMMALVAIGLWRAAAQ